MNLHIINYFDTLYNVFTEIQDLHVHIFTTHCLHGVCLSDIYAYIYDTALDFAGCVFPQKRGRSHPQMYKKQAARNSGCVPPCFDFRRLFAELRGAA